MPHNVRTKLWCLMCIFLYITSSSSNSEEVKDRTFFNEENNGHAFTSTNTLKSASKEDGHQSRQLLNSCRLGKIVRTGRQERDLPDYGDYLQEKDLPGFGKAELNFLSWWKASDSKKMKNGSTSLTKSNPTKKLGAPEDPSSVPPLQSTTLAADANAAFNGTSLAANTTLGNSTVSTNSTASALDTAASKGTAETTTASTSTYLTTCYTVTDTCLPLLTLVAAPMCTEPSTTSAPISTSLTTVIENTTAANINLTSTSETNTTQSALNYTSKGTGPTTIQPGSESAPTQALVQFAGQQAIPNPFSVTNGSMVIPLYIIPPVTQLIVLNTVLPYQMSTLAADMDTSDEDLQYNQYPTRRNNEELDLISKNIHHNSNTNQTCSNSMSNFSSDVENSEALKNISAQETYLINEQSPQNREVLKSDKLKDSSTSIDHREKFLNNENQLERAGNPYPQDKENEPPNHLKTESDRNSLVSQNKKNEDSQVNISSILNIPNSNSSHEHISTNHEFSIARAEKLDEPSPQNVATEFNLKANFKESKFQEIPYNSTYLSVHSSNNRQTSPIGQNNDLKDNSEQKSGNTNTFQEILKYSSNLPLKSTNSNDTIHNLGAYSVNVSDKEKDKYTYNYNDIQKFNSDVLIQNNRTSETNNHASIYPVIYQWPSTAATISRNDSQYLTKEEILPINYGSYQNTSKMQISSFVPDKHAIGVASLNIHQMEYEQTPTNLSNMKESFEKETENLPKLNRINNENTNAFKHDAKNIPTDKNFTGSAVINSYHEANEKSEIGIKENSIQPTHLLPQMPVLDMNHKEGNRELNGNSALQLRSSNEHSIKQNTNKHNQGFTLLQKSSGKQIDNSYELKLGEKEIPDDLSNFEEVDKGRSSLNSDAKPSEAVGKPSNINMYFKYNDTFLAQHSINGQNLIDICKNVTCKGNDYLAQCCGAKVFSPGKCHGEDFSYLLPIPGDTTTTSVKPNSKGLSNVRVTRDNTMNDFVKFQLMHGITAPDGKELMNALREAKLQMQKVSKEFHPEKGSNSVQILNPFPLAERQIYMKKQAENVPSLIDTNKILENLRTTISESLHHTKLRPNPMENEKFRTVRNQILSDPEETLRENFILDKLREETERELKRISELELRRRQEEEAFNKEKETNLKELKAIRDLIHKEFENQQYSDSEKRDAFNYPSYMTPNNNDEKNGKEGTYSKLVHQIGNSIISNEAKDIMFDRYSEMKSNNVSNYHKPESPSVELSLKEIKFPELEMKQIMNEPNDISFPVIKLEADSANLKEQKRIRRNSAKNKQINIPDNFLPEESEFTNDLLKLGERKQNDRIEQNFNSLHNDLFDLQKYIAHKMGNEQCSEISMEASGSSLKEKNSYLVQNVHKFLV